MGRSVVVRAAVLALVTATSLLSLSRDGQAQTSDLLTGAVDGGFEADGAGWVATSAAQAVLDAVGPVHSGARAMRVEATQPGLVGVQTQPWRVSTVGGVTHAARVWVYDDDPGTSTLEVELLFFAADGITTRNSFFTSVGNGTSGWQLVTVSLSGAPDTAYAGIEVRAIATGAGPRFYIDDVTLERGPLPPPTPTPTSGGTPVPTPGGSPTVTATPVSTRTATASPVATARTTVTPTAVAAPRVFDVLTNGDFSSGLYGWSDIGADVEVVGGAARISSASTSTKYLYQTVRVTPGAWYQAGAYIELGAGVDAAWMRLAWYASSDGSGSQLATRDSPTLTSGAAEVETGPLQAPAEAHSAQVRVMLRPLSGGAATLTIDDVWFAPSSAPPPPAPTVTSSPASAPPAASSSSDARPAASPSTGAAPGAPASTEAPPAAGGSAPPDEGTPAPRLVAGRPVDAGGGAPASGPTSGRPAAASTGSGSTSSRGARGTATASGASGSATASRVEGFAPEILLRITELMPDPSEPGNDADFEWVEVSNVGWAPIALAGIVLRDNSGVVALPDRTLPAGASLVLAGPRAAVPQSSAFWPPGGLSNGLGNSGDRLALLSADGRLIDALSYGSDATYDNPPLPAPDAGRSLKRFFGDDGTYAGHEVSEEPSPGRSEPPPARLVDSEEAAGEGSQAAIGRGGDDRATWYVLGGLGAVALVGAAGQRLWAMRRGGGGGPAAGSGV